MPDSTWHESISSSLALECSYMFHLQALGPRWAGRPDREVMDDSEYWQDILKAGPTMGMTFMIAAARDVPVDTAAR